MELDQQKKLNVNKIEEQKSKLIGNETEQVSSASVFNQSIWLVEKNYFF